MDEYCNHCAPKHGMKNSFIGLVQYGHTANVYCKGCGITHVNHLGECLKCKGQSSHSVKNKGFVLLIVALIGVALALFYGFG